MHKDIFELFGTLHSAPQKVLTVHDVLKEMRKVKTEAMNEPTRLDYLIRIDRGFHQVADLIREKINA